MASAVVGFDNRVGFGTKKVCRSGKTMCLHTRIQAGYVCGKGPENAAVISSSGEAAPREAGARRELFELHRTLILATVSAVASS